MHHLPLRLQKSACLVLPLLEVANTSCNDLPLAYLAKASTLPKWLRTHHVGNFPLVNFSLRPTLPIFFVYPTRFYLRYLPQKAHVPPHQLFSSFSLRTRILLDIWTSWGPNFTAKEEKLAVGHGIIKHECESFRVYLKSDMLFFQGLKVPGYLTGLFKPYPGRYPDTPKVQTKYPANHPWKFPLLCDNIDNYSVNLCTCSSSWVSLATSCSRSCRHLPSALTTSDARTASASLRERSGKIKARCSVRKAVLPTHGTVRGATEKYGAPYRGTLYLARKTLALGNMDVNEAKQSHRLSGQRTISQNTKRY